MTNEEKIKAMLEYQQDINDALQTQIKDLFQIVQQQDKRIKELEGKCEVGS